MVRNTAYLRKLRILPPPGPRVSQELGSSLIAPSNTAGLLVPVQSARLSNLGGSSLPYLLVSTLSQWRSTTRGSPWNRLAENCRIDKQSHTHSWNVLFHEGTGGTCCSLIIKTQLRVITITHSHLLPSSLLPPSSSPPPPRLGDHRTPHNHHGSQKLRSTIHSRPPHRIHLRALEHFADVLLKRPRQIDSYQCREFRRILRGSIQAFYSQLRRYSFE